MHCGQAGFILETQSWFKTGGKIHIIHSAMTSGTNYSEGAKPHQSSARLLLLRPQLCVLDFLYF